VHACLVGVWLALRNELVIDTPFAPHSGGSWLTGSLYMNDFPTIKDLVFGNGDKMHGWLLDLPLATPDGADVFSKNNQEWYDSILGSIFAKGETGM
jgi:lysophospholipase